MNLFNRFTEEEGHALARRLDMAMKEAGCVGETILKPQGFSIQGLPVFSVVWQRPDNVEKPSRRMFWRSRELAEMNEPCCFACFDARELAWCKAERRLMESCCEP